MDWRGQGVKLSVTKATTKGPRRDYVFRNFMSGRGNRLGVSLPESVRRLIYRDGLPALGIRPVLSLAAAILVAGTVAYGLVTVSPISGNDQAGLRSPIPLPAAPDPELVKGLRRQDQSGTPQQEVKSTTISRVENIYKVDLGNNVFLEMIRVPSGEFLMGEDASGLAEFERECGRYLDDKAKCKDYADDHAPQHRVSVNEFLIGRYEVTQRQWKAVMGGLPPGMAELEAKFKGDDLPVVMVSWDEIQEFLRRIGTEYRLPSEAEWEYAARAGTTTAYAFGSEISPAIVNYDGNYPAGNQPKGLYREAPIAVGSLGRANAWGLFDMHGNVWEWCADNWHDSYKGAPADGRVWREGGEAADRVVRGASWGSDAVHCRSADRSGNAPGSRYNGVGFRLSSTLPSAPSPLALIPI